MGCVVVPFTNAVGIDLGTCSVLVFVPGKGIVLREPSVVARQAGSREILAVGDEAKRMIGKTPRSIVTVRPLREGVISDIEVTEAMVKYFLQKAIGRRILFKPSLIMCVPAAVTTVERRAVLQSGYAAGAGKVFLIEEPVAAALGVGLDITGPRGNMVVDIGGGTTDIAVLSLNGVVAETSTRVGGDALDQAIVKYLRKVYKVYVGDNTAEQAKIVAGSADPLEEKEAEVRGRDVITGLPRDVTVKSSDLREAISEPLELIALAVRMILDKTPPELLGDIIQQGIWLTGGGALLDGIDRYLSKVTGVTVKIAEDPISCVARGTSAVIDRFSLYERHMKSLEA